MLAPAAARHFPSFVVISFFNYLLRIHGFCKGLGKQRAFPIADAKRMLKITVSETASEQRWKLQGRLAGPWVEQLQSCWARAQAERPGRSCVIDVTNLTSVDGEGEMLLQAMINQGARFHACGVYIKHVLENLSRQCKPDFH